MKILKHENKMIILEIKDWTYLISYETPIAKVNNTIKTNKNEYGLYFTSSWDFSQTTLKHLYNFIELYTTQRDENNNMFSYMLNKVANKKTYLQKQIDLGNIKIIKEEDF